MEFVLLSDEVRKKLCEELIHRKDGLEGYRQMVEHEHLVPPIFFSDDKKTETNESCQALIAELRKNTLRVERR